MRQVPYRTFRVFGQYSHSTRNLLEWHSKDDLLSLATTRCYVSLTTRQLCWQIYDHILIYMSTI